MFIIADRSDLLVSTVSLASSAADSDALDTIQRHHAELVGGLTARTAGLLAAVRRGEDWEGAREALVAWCRGDLLPHAEAEEAVLHRAALGLAPLEPLVRAMSYGHTCGCHDAGEAAPELDARVIPHAIRHATIFGALGAVAPAAEMILVAPHDPLPLLHQIEQRWPAAFDIDYLERGPDAWRLRFTRVAAESVA